MYSQEPRYCVDMMEKVPSSHEDEILDLRVRIQEDPNENVSQDKSMDDRLCYPDLRLNSETEAAACAASSNISPLPPNVTHSSSKSKKPTRPFKAYPKYFYGYGNVSGILDDSDRRYLEFRTQFLSQLHANTGGSAGNKNMKRPFQSGSPNQLPTSSGDAKDQAYWERRKKNNEAAKKSRDARRAKEDEIAIRAAFLERENFQLKYELASLKGEVERLRCMVYERS